PVADSQSLTNNENTPLAITLSGSDVEGSPLTYRVVNSPTHGALSGTAPNLVYTPATNFFGADAFTYVANDGTNDAAPATVSLTIFQAADPPMLDAEAAELIELATNSVTLTGTVIYDDFPGTVDTVQWTQISGPSGVTFSDPSNEVTTVSFMQSGIYQ